MSSSTPLPLPKIVAGIGGVFIYSPDPARLAAWYRKHLHIETIRDGDVHYRLFAHRDSDAPDREWTTTWAILPAPADVAPTLAAAPRTGRVNYRVVDMEAALAHLARDKIAIDSREDHGYGRFAMLKDLDGNVVELFQETR